VKRYGRTSVGAASRRRLVCATSTTTWSPAPTASTARGPIRCILNSSGFDPSLFHDDDGRKYLLNQLWDHRPGRNRFAGIVAQEYDGASRRGWWASVENIFKGTPHGLTEAPHHLQARRLLLPAHRRGRHRLWNHGGDDGRARATLAGPYELHPDTYILSSRARPDAELQRAGHADLVETPDGQTYAVYLCGRPLPNRARCVWAARPRSSRWSGATTAGCAPSTAGACRA
jgi:xylan 1,4-beta-xylosidase